jgi:hypothetical protein
MTLKLVAAAVQRPTVKFVVTTTVDQLDLTAQHRVRERLELAQSGRARASWGFTKIKANRCILFRWAVPRI